MRGRLLSMSPEWRIQPDKLARDRGTVLKGEVGPIK